MGVLEQILETNKLLTEQIASLSDTVSSMQAKIDDIRNKDKLVLEFSDNETLNSSMTARVLGLKQHELDELIAQGLLQSKGERKRIFLAKDILTYLKYKDNPKSNVNIPPPKEKKKKKRDIPVQEVISRDEWAKLVSMNS